jgi:hypothetical protein
MRVVATVGGASGSRLRMSRRPARFTLAEAALRMCGGRLAP